MNSIIDSILVLFLLCGVVAASNYSYPRILILGPTGVGKSSLGNVLAGCEPDDKNCSFFPICPSVTESCTKDTTIAEARYLGNLTSENAAILDDGNVTLIDSPGFGDSDGEDSTLIPEMVDVLKNMLGDANTILLCFEAVRFNDGIQKMILELESLFGRDRLWNNVVIEITKWAFDSKSIADRERAGITEEGTLDEINNLLQKKFHLNRSLPGVFIDSWAVYYPDDEVQQQYFLKYTRDLWEASNAMDPFSFFTIEDILNQLHTCQIKNDCLNEVLEERLTKLENNVDNIKDDIMDINDDIIDNGIEIADLSGIVSMNQLDIKKHGHNITEHGNIISKYGSDIYENRNNISKNRNDISKNRNDISKNRDDISKNRNDISANVNRISATRDDISKNRKEIINIISSYSCNEHNINVVAHGQNSSIASANYPHNYPNGVDCTIKLTTPCCYEDEWGIRLEFTDFRVSCKDGDFVEISPPINGRSRFCGGYYDSPPKTIFEMWTTVSVRFYSSPSGDTSKGWIATAEVHGCMEGCQKRLKMDQILK